MPTAQTMITMTNRYDCGTYDDDSVVCVCVGGGGGGRGGGGRRVCVCFLLRIRERAHAYVCMVACVCLRCVFVCTANGHIGKLLFAANAT